MRAGTVTAGVELRRPLERGGADPLARRIAGANGSSMAALAGQSRHGIATSDAVRLRLRGIRPPARRRCARPRSIPPKGSSDSGWRGPCSRSAPRRPSSASRGHDASAPVLGAARSGRGRAAWRRRRGARVHLRLSLLAIATARKSVACEPPVIAAGSLAVDLPLRRRGAHADCRATGLRRRRRPRSTARPVCTTVENRSGVSASGALAYQLFAQTRLPCASRVSAVARRDAGGDGVSDPRRRELAEPAHAVGRLVGAHPVGGQPVVADRERVDRVPPPRGARVAAAVRTTGPRARVKPAERARGHRERQARRVDRRPDAARRRVQHLGVDPLGDRQQPRVGEPREVAPCSEALDVLGQWARRSARLAASTPRPGSRPRA